MKWAFNLEIPENKLEQKDKMQLEIMSKKFKHISPKTIKIVEAYLKRKDEVFSTSLISQ